MTETFEPASKRWPYVAYWHECDTALSYLQFPLAAPERTCSGNARRAEFDPSGTLATRSASYARGCTSFRDDIITLARRHC